VYNALVPKNFCVYPAASGAQVDKLERIHLTLRMQVSISLTDSRKIAESLDLGRPTFPTSSQMAMVLSSVQRIHILVDSNHESRRPHGTHCMWEVHGFSSQLLSYSESIPGGANLPIVPDPKIGSPQLTLACQGVLAA
jgi:hypothetical protein